MKIQIIDYTFNKTAKTITFTDYSSIVLSRVLAVINTTSNVTIYSPVDPTKGGTVATNVLTLAYDTSSMNNTDSLLIYYDDPIAITSFEVDLTMANPTTTAYTVGDALGGNFTITGAAKFKGGNGIIQSVELITTMPSTAYRDQAVTATNASPCVFTLNSHTLVNGNRVRMGSTGTPPTNFTAGVDYYVVSAAANTFQLSTTIGGTGQASASTGTNVTITQYPAQLPTVFYLTNATLGSISDNSAFYPTEAQSQSKIGSYFMNIDALVSDYKENDLSVRNIGVPYQVAATDTSLYGLFIFTGTSGAALAAGSKIRARINLIIN